MEDIFYYNEYSNYFHLKKSGSTSYLKKSLQLN